MYRLIAFGTQTLEYYNQVDEIGSGPSPVNYAPLAEGGAYDLFGSAQKHPGAVERLVSRRLKESTTAALNDLYLELLKLRGKRDRLYRRTASGELHWNYARLVALSAKRDYQQTRFKYIQDLDLQFVTQEAFWHGTIGGTWYLDDGEYLETGLLLDNGLSYALTASPMALALAVGSALDAGRAPVRAIQITISAGASPITALTIARAGGETLTFSGTIAANKALVIDTGTMQVLNDGVSAYADLTFTATADMAAWFTLQPGANNLTITYTGGGTGKNIDFVYPEAWY